MTTVFTLPQLGWSPFFQQQLTLDEWEHCVAARVVAQHRGEVELLAESGKQRLALLESMPPLTVGDWLLLKADGRFHRLLDRLSVFSRMAAGNKVAAQLIAANIDTVFIVCSLNENFNLNRIERYLSLSRDAGAEAVVVLTKADVCDDSQRFVDQVQALDPLLMVEAVNALDTQTIDALSPWCSMGKTVALLGSSGVGKSTLVNTLMGKPMQHTSAIRGADGKGRHTTTTRSLHFLPSGGSVLDTPGMRELKLAGCEEGVNTAFADVHELSRQCRYSDCQHQSEPGCAVQRAIEQGELDARRFSNYRKLLREQALNGATMADRRAQGRKLTRYYRSVQSEALQRKKGR